MEPLAFADLVPAAAAALFLAIATGVYGPRLASVAVAWGLAVRLLLVGLRAAGFGAPIARTEDAKHFAEGSLALSNGRDGVYFRGGSQRWEEWLALGRRHLDLSVVGLELMAVLIWVLGAWFLLSAIRSTSIDARTERVLWIVALHPAGLLWTSGLLRESSEFAFAALAVWVFVHLQRMPQHGALSRTPVLAAAATLAAGGLLHEALLYAAVAVVAGHEVLRVVGLLEGVVRKGPLAAVGVVVLLAAITLSGPVETLMSERLTEGADTGGASYVMSVPSFGPLTVSVDVAIRYALYLLSPLPWTLRGPFDLLGIADVALRVVLIVGAWRNRRHGPTLVLLLMAVAIQLCFSVGTVNWGTAMRHHYVSLAPLVAAYAISRRPSAVERRRPALPAPSHVMV